MAAANATKSTPLGDNSTEVWTWVLTATNTSGSPVQVQNGDVTVQVGTTGDAFNTGTVAIQGSNHEVAFTTLDNPNGTAMSYTAAALQAVQQQPLYIQPTVTAGAVTQVTVVMTVRRPQPTRN